MMEASAQTTELASSEFEQTLSDAQVADYLSQHPDFFVKHAELAASIKIPHKQKGSVSLVELQSSQLRNKVDQLSFQLNQLIDIARQNQEIYEVFAELNLSMLSCTSLQELTSSIEHVLKHQLGMSSVVFVPFSGQHAISEIQQRALTDKRFNNTDFFFGRLSQHETQLLFAEQVASSTALILLGEQRDLGVLAIGHADAGHFSPDMDTLFLKQLT